MDNLTIKEKIFAVRIPDNGIKMCSHDFRWMIIMMDCLTTIEKFEDFNVLKKEILNNYIFWKFKTIIPYFFEKERSFSPFFISLFGQKKDIKKGYSKLEWNQNFSSVKDFYESLEWKNTRIEVLKRDKYICQCCGSQASRNVHHLNSPMFSPELSLDPKNLIVLCDECHKKWHKLGGIDE